MCIPFYYFIPKSILSRCGAELNAILRNLQELFHNRTACEFVESDLFRLLIIDATAFMVWPYMGFDEYMEIYSGYDPAWRFAHCPDYWIKELEDEEILAPTGEFFQGCHSELGYVPEWQIDIYLRYIVPNVMKKHRMDEIIQVAREYPLFRGLWLPKEQPENGLHPKMVPYPHQAPDDFTGGISGDLCRHPRPARKPTETTCGRMWNTACPLRPAQENLKVSFMRSAIRLTLCAFRLKRSIGSVPCG